MIYFSRMPNFDILDINNELRQIAEEANNEYMNLHRVGCELYKPLAEKFKKDLAGEFSTEEARDILDLVFGATIESLLDMYCYSLYSITMNLIEKGSFPARQSDFTRLFDLKMAANTWARFCRYWYIAERYMKLEVWKSFYQYIRYPEIFKEETGMDIMEVIWPLGRVKEFDELLYNALQNWDDLLTTDLDILKYANKKILHEFKKYYDAHRADMG